VQPPGDAGASAAIVDAAAYPLLGALFMQTPVMDQMDNPTREQLIARDRGKEDKGPHRLGYLRRGAKVPVLPQPHVNDACKEGWYELVYGGFVCGKYATLDMNHPKLQTAPHAPFLDQPLPYQYAYNIAHGTPLYRTVPSTKERLAYEPWLVHKPKPKVEEEDAGVITDYAATNVASLGVSFGFDPDDAGTPWYLKDWDGGKPQITLDDLREDSGPIIRRMVKGFYVALDTDIEVNHRKWWKTTAGYLAPYDRMIIAKQPTDFHGVWLNTASPPDYPPAVAQADGGVPPYWVDHPPTHLPVGFVTWPKSKKYDADGKATGDILSRFTPLQLTGQKKIINSAWHYEIEGGTWIRAENIIVTDPGPAPADLKPGEKWIDVNLDNQSLVAYEGETPKYVTLVSTGEAGLEDPDTTKSTKTGIFRIHTKHVTTTMASDVVGEEFELRDIPYVQYFEQGYALHGAYWHDRFGTPKSHGCVNLSPEDARRLFFFTEPALPTGWHGVSKALTGSVVFIHA